jgi:hypothetical protein
MKKLFRDATFGRNSMVSGTVALAIVALIALGCSCGKIFEQLKAAKEANLSNANFETQKKDSADDSAPTESVVEDLVKDTTAQFAEAIDSNDFSDLYSEASSDFRSTYSIDEIKTAFKTYVDKKRIVLPVLNKVPAAAAEFSQPPYIRTERNLKILVAKGKFRTKPYTVSYDYEYIRRDDQWKLLKLVINIP